MVGKPNKVQPAVIGGLIVGILTSIPFVNCFCCLWMILGGAVAARMLIKRSPVLPITTGEGAVVGALAGVVGAVVLLVIGLPISLVAPDLQTAMLERFADMTNDPTAREQLRQMIEQIEGQPLGQRAVAGLFEWLIRSVIAIAFSTLGGIIGVALFEKRKGQQPPPPAGPMGYPPQGPPPGYAPPSPPPGGPQSPY